MAHLGVLCYQGAGHLNPLIALSRELVSRGHRVTFFLPRELESNIQQHGLDFFPLNIPELESTRADNGSGAQLSSGWIQDTRGRLNRLDQEIGIYLQEYRAAISASNVDALVMGEISLAGPTVAEVLRTPYFVVSTSIPHNFGWSAPQRLLPYRTWQEELRAKIFEVSIFYMRGPVQRILDRYRNELGLGPVANIGKTFGALAHITQWPRCLEQTCHEIPEPFFHTGPFINPEARSSIEFPWHELNGKPLVYASLGTTRKADPEIYHRIATACAGLDLQLVITLGGRRNIKSFTNLPRNPLVIENAPQLDLLKRASLVITHAGPNTVLETLQCGLPMLALPIALDQPAVAARLEMLGVAEVLPPQHCSAEEIREALLKLSTEDRYRTAARQIQVQLQSLEGAVQAASIIEEALANSGPSACYSEALNRSS